MARTRVPSGAAMSTPWCSVGDQPRIRTPYGEVMVPETGQRGTEQPPSSSAARSRIAVRRIRQMVL
jgi:hypothetical protein